MNMDYVAEKIMRTFEHLRDSSGGVNEDYLKDMKDKLNNKDDKLDSLVEVFNMDQLHLKKFAQLNDVDVDDLESFKKVLREIIN